MCSWIRLLVFIYSCISSIFFLSNSKTLNFLSHFSVRPSKLKLDTHVYLFLYFFSFLCSKFQTIKFFVTLFCEAFKVETWYIHEQGVVLLCAPNTNSQNILVPLFFFFFLSLQLAKINMYMGVYEVCSLTLCYIFITELWPLIDVRILFPLNIFNTNWWISTKFCICIDTHKI